MMLTAASEVVGETQALKPMAMPRPLFTGPAPRSNGFCHSISADSRSRDLLDRGVAQHRAGRPAAGLRAAGSCGGTRSGSMPRLRAIMSVWPS
jgi:hypothetical protein